MCRKKTGVPRQACFMAPLSTAPGRLCLLDAKPISHQNFPAEEVGYGREAVDSDSVHLGCVNKLAKRSQLSKII